MAPAFASMILLRATPRATQATTACARAQRPVYILLIDGPVKLSLAPSPPAQFAPTLIPFRSSSIHPKSRQVRHPEPVQNLTFGCVSATMRDPPPWPSLTAVAKDLRVISTLVSSVIHLLTRSVSLPTQMNGMTFPRQSQITWRQEMTWIPRYSHYYARASTVRVYDTSRLARTISRRAVHPWLRNCQPRRRPRRRNRRERVEQTLHARDPRYTRLCCADQTEVGVVHMMRPWKNTLFIDNRHAQASFSHSRPD